VIDLHCHVLPGIDDGPKTMRDSLALCRQQAQLGIRTVVATPHVNWDWPGNTPAVIAGLVVEVNAALAQEGIDVEVLPGAEVALTRAIELSDDELRQLRLGGGPWLLLEPPHSPAAGAGAEASIVSLLHRGHRLLIAHPERCPAFLADREGLERLVMGGALCSITASALTGRFGRDVKKFAVGMLEDGLVHNVASDAHGPDLRRAPGLAEHLQEAGYGDLAPWLCQDVPRALLDDATPPPRPARDGGRRRGGLSRLLRRA
jgi:protein-tyrosine phosphatase